MGNLPCGTCNGLCCGPVPITKQELHDIKVKLKNMPVKTRSELEHQLRFFGTCIFYDNNNQCCGIYSFRPSICRVFGNYSNLICFQNPGAASDKNWHPSEAPVGVLSADFTWKDF